MVTLASASDRLAQHPLEGGAAHDEHGQVLVARTGLAEVGVGRHGDAADGEQRLEHVGEALAQDDHDAGQEAVGLVHLLGAAPLGGEGGLGVAGDG